MDFSPAGRANKKKHQKNKRHYPEGLHRDGKAEALPVNINWKVYHILVEKYTTYNVKPVALGNKKQHKNIW